MTTAIIPVLMSMYLGSTFNLNKYQKGDADVFDPQMITPDKLQVIDRSFTRSQYKVVETSIQAREFLDVTGALSLRIKKGEISVAGSGQYLKDISNRQNFVELLVRVQHETVTETIPSYIKPKTDWMSRPPESVGTHYVRSITFGGELVASLRLRAENREEKELIKAAVGANLQLTGTFDLNANGSFDKLKKDLAGMFQYEIKVMATKNPSSPPQTIEELMKIVDEYPKEISSINKGKGNPLKAELYPLTSLKHDYPNYLPNSVVNSLLNDVETKYDDIRVVMHDIIPWNRNRPETTEEDDEKVDEMFAVLEEAQRAFHNAISNMDTSITGKTNQFQEAFKSYGEGKENVPNRFQRWFWKLRHEITKEEIGWDRPAGSGSVYTNWGSDKCIKPSKSKNGVRMLHKGKAATTLRKAWAGGRDFLCAPDENPALSRPLSMLPRSASVDAVEYRDFLNPGTTHPVICASCLVENSVTVKTFYAARCPNGWDLAYSGYALADITSNVDYELMCLNKMAFKEKLTSQSASHLAQLHPVWMWCDKCKKEKVLPCVVCSF